MRFFFAFFLIFIIVQDGRSQQAFSGNCNIKINLSNTTEMPLSITVRKSDFGDYTNSRKSIPKIAEILYVNEFIDEPTRYDFILSWKNNRQTRFSFLAVPGNYDVVFEKNLTAKILGNDSLSKLLKDLENRVITIRNTGDSLVKKVDYENKKVEDVEKRIAFIKDSVELEIDTAIYKKAIFTNLKSPLALYALCKYAERPYINQRHKSQPDSILTVFNKLDSNLHELPSAKILLNKLSTGEKMEIGNLISDITLPDTASKEVKISDFKGKYVLIDFWATWCTPCRQENPFLISAFQKYEKFGFNIIGITTNRQSERYQWLEAIRTDKTNIWPQLSDFDKVAQKLYGIQFIPTNYLIGPNGEIIARDLRGEELAKKLKEVFKY